MEYTAVYNNVPTAMLRYPKKYQDIIQMEDVTLVQYQKISKVVRSE